MNRREAIAYCDQLVEHPDTDQGIRELAAAYLELDHGYRRIARVGLILSVAAVIVSVVALVLAS